MQKTKLTTRDAPTKKKKDLPKLKIKVNPKKTRCGKCKRTSGIIKFYIHPDDLKVKHYHAACYKSLKINRK
jgi:hypothetical protein